MVAPHHFFSTLAQASAAIVGFVVAVGTLSYSIERQRFRERWNYEEFGAFQDICYTPTEYDEYRERPNSLVQTAESKGIQLI